MPHHHPYFKDEESEVRRGKVEVTELARFRISGSNDCTPQIEPHIYLMNHSRVVTHGLENNELEYTQGKVKLMNEMIRIHIIWIMTKRMGGINS